MYVITLPLKKMSNVFFFTLEASIKNMLDTKSKMYKIFSDYAYYFKIYDLIYFFK